MFELSRESATALDEFCESLTQEQAHKLRAIIERVCADPAGRREPRHSYTRRFANARRYVPSFPADTKAWEFKTNHYRGIFITREVTRGDVQHRLLIFLPVIRLRARFFRSDECPWPH